MAERKPVVLVGGQLKELPASDTLPPQAPAVHSHATSDVTGLDAALSGKEPAISTGSTSQYFRGDKTWRDFFTDVRAATLTGLSTATNTAVAATDTVLAAIGKLQAQVNGISIGVNREKLLAARTYYVSPTGNDSNNGLTPGSAFLTVQKAIDTAATLDLATFQITIKLADGTYTGNVIPKNYVGDGPIVIEGNVTTPNNVVLSGTSGNLVFASALKSKYTFRKMKAQTSGSGASCFYVEKGGALDLDGVNFGACVSVHVLSADGSTVFINSSYEVSGGAYAHWYCSFGSNLIVVGGVAVTLIGTPAFTVAWAFAPAAGNIRANGITFSGAAAGVRYKVELNSVVQTQGGISYLPGNASGTTATGGQYI